MEGFKSLILSIIFFPYFLKYTSHIHTSSIQRISVAAQRGNSASKLGSTGNFASDI